MTNVPLFPLMLTLRFVVSFETLINLRLLPESDHVPVSETGAPVEANPGI